jgi:hypothetical protein
VPESEILRPTERSRREVVTNITTTDGYGYFGTRAIASHHFNNALRYRPADHPGQEWLTPPYVLDPVTRLLGGIDLDPCTTVDNPTRARRFCAPPQDGLAFSWEDARSIFVNPPYGKARERWVERCIETGEAGVPVVLLMPAHPDTRIFQRAAASADGVLFLRGRVKFGILRPNRRQVAASHPSALFGWNVDLNACRALGIVLADNPPGSRDSHEH